jgi:hypothetical protein
MADIRERLTRYHTCFHLINEKTRVFYVGPDITALTHTCHARSNGKPGPFPNEGKLEYLKMEKPTANATPASHCNSCNTLYLATVEKEE